MPKSTLNALLLKFDSLYHTKRCKKTDAVLNEIILAIQKNIYAEEVNHDLFDGVSAETRKAVLGGFVHSTYQFLNQPFGDAGVVIVEVDPAKALEILGAGGDLTKVLRDPKTRLRRAAAQQKPEGN